MAVTYSCCLEAKDVLDLNFDLAKFSGVNVQLNFYHGFPKNHDAILDQLGQNDISVTSIHAPTVAFSDPEFFHLIKAMQDIYEVSTITIHPVKSPKSDLVQIKSAEMNALLDLEGQLTDSDVQICLENFPSRGRNGNDQRWVYDPLSLFGLACVMPHLGITYDISHTVEGIDLLTEFELVSSKVGVLHLSNRIIPDNSDEKWQVHLPYRRGSLMAPQLVGYLSSTKFQGEVVLEYDARFMDKMLLDYQELTEVTKDP
ncbi:sugar phosphate isomerase/epimerase [Candidatus Woesearchaeota archaeon]|jgi:sugar phosphate isomerase/epimerase|nr:sugar phosphate isomerase/epimerase [Candidatus Woesearchaeota archaeon]